MAGRAVGTGEAGSRTLLTSCRVLAATSQALHSSNMSSVALGATSSLLLKGRMETSDNSWTKGGLYDPHLSNSVLGLQALNTTQCCQENTNLVVQQ